MPLDGNYNKFQLIRLRMATKPHGTRLRYFGGCRCVPCRAAHSRYNVESRRRNRRGEGNPHIAAAPVVAHLRELSKQGIGYKTACEVAGVGARSIALKLSGKSKTIRALNAQAILAVTPEIAALDGTRIDAGPTKRRIRWLLNEGMTNTEIARRLGYKWGMLHFKKRKKITARNAMRIEQLVNLMRLGE